jgi:hypothetical protein
MTSDDSLLFAYPRISLFKRCLLDLVFLILLTARERVLAMVFTRFPNTLFPFISLQAHEALSVVFFNSCFLVRSQSSYYFDTLIPHWFF